MKIPLLYDMHVHLRSGKLLHKVAKYTSNTCNYAILMPNIENPVVDSDSLGRYTREVSECVKNSPKFTPLFTLKLTNRTDYKTIHDLKNHISAIKIYPSNATTNSSDGISAEFIKNPKKSLNFYECLKTIEDLQIPLLWHGELPEVVCMEREKEFLKYFLQYLVLFPQIKTVLEHITTKESVSFVKKFSKNHNLAATITLHHMMLNIDDVVGNQLNYHNFCKPLPKMDEDMVSLTEAAISGEECFFYGSDSAPHETNQKFEEGCAGVFSAPVALQCLAHIFENQSEKLNLFARMNAAKFYNLPVSKDYIELEKCEWIVPSHFDGIKPLYANRQIGYKVV